MADGALDRFQRLLRVLPLLADGERHSYASIAKRSGVPVETVIADLRAVAEREDDPGGYVASLQIQLDGKEAAVISAPFRRPMRLTGRELAALELGLALLRVESPPEERPVLDRARKKIRETILKLAPGDGLGPTAADLGGEVDLSMLAALRKAVRDQLTVRITYQGSGKGRRDLRTVHPYALLPRAGTWYLVAHCKEAEGLRIFRMDRIGSLTTLASTFKLPKEFSLDAVLRDGRVFMAKETATVRIRYSAKIARWIGEREGKQVDADGSLTLEHPLADPTWAIRHVLQYGRDAEILAPPGLRAMMRKRLKG